MKITEVVQQLQRLIAIHPRDDAELVVRVCNPGTLGGTPCVAVKSLHAGIDWDKGKVMLTLEAPVTQLTPEQVTTIEESARQGQSWHSYQIHKKNKDRINSLEAELAALRGAK